MLLFIVLLLIVEPGARDSARLCRSRTGRAIAFRHATAGPSTGDDEASSSTVDSSSMRTSMGRKRTRPFLIALDVHAMSLPLGTYSK
jgi:hypothetical protein